MALTEQEKQERLDKLKEYEGWFTFTDSQRVFLEGMAHGMKPIHAFKRAYPDTKEKSLVFALQQMLCRVGIQKALSTIGIDTNKSPVSKKEAIELLSIQLRKAPDAATLVKLLSLYSKLSGWDKEDDEEPGEEVSLDKLVAAVEKRRKAGNGKHEENG